MATSSTRIKTGYTLGLLLSCLYHAVVLVYLYVEAIGCAMSLGCTAGFLESVLKGVGYLLGFMLIALGVRTVYRTSLSRGFFLNVTAAILVTALLFATRMMNGQIEKLQMAIDLRRAISDYDLIQLGQPEARFKGSTRFGVFMDWYVPFTVTAPVKQRSIDLLAGTRKTHEGIQFALTSVCNEFFEMPGYSYHVVENVDISERGTNRPERNFRGQYTMGDTLMPGKIYYLLTQYSFKDPSCTPENYEGFDPADIPVSLDKRRPLEALERL